MWTWAGAPVVVTAVTGIAGVVAGGVLYGRTFDSDLYVYVPAR